MAIYFTSDTHFGHGNIIDYENRPFATTDDMDALLIHNVNKRVKPADTLYHLGDFAVGQGRHKVSCIKQVLSRIACDHVHLVLGNHDPKDSRSLLDCGFASVSQIFDVSCNGYRFVLCHYPFLEWPGFYRGSYHLHGHVHEDGSYNFDMRDKHHIRRHDVGVDANRYAPVSVDEIIEFFTGDPGL